VLLTTGGCTLTRCRRFQLTGTSGDTHVHRVAARLGWILPNATADKAYRLFSQLWALPRRRRFGPLLAGLAVDSAVLALLLAVELTAAVHWWAPPVLVTALAAALVFVETAAMTWQCLLFLRTDLYGVLVVATGCHNLWRVKTLSLRSALRMLSPAEAAELAAASSRDRAVAAWFRWLWLAGHLAAAAWFAWFYLPVLARVAAWTGLGLATGPGTGRFWITTGCVVILAWRIGAPLVFTLSAAARRTGR
jgi:hypothetical protein